MLPYSPEWEWLRHCRPWPPRESPFSLPAFYTQDFEMMKIANACQVPKQHRTLKQPTSPGGGYYYYSYLKGQEVEAQGQCLV